MFGNSNSIDLVYSTFPPIRNLFVNKIKPPSSPKQKIKVVVYFVLFYYSEFFAPHFLRFRLIHSTISFGSNNVRWERLFLHKDLFILCFFLHARNKHKNNSFLNKFNAKKINTNAVSSFLLLHSVNQYSSKKKVQNFCYDTVMFTSVIHSMTHTFDVK